MNKKLLSQIQGQWKYQQTLYNINNKKLINYQSSVHVYNTELNKYKIIHNEFVNIIHDENRDKITKLYKEKHTMYSLSMIQKNKIVVLYSDKNIKFKEVFYIINENFFIVVGILKEHNKYFSISMNSFIKIL